MSDEDQFTRVLVVEAQPLFRDALLALLTAAGFAAHAERGSPYSGLELALHSFRPHVVLVGLDPAVDASIDVLRHLPAIAEHWRTLVIAVTDQPVMYGEVIELGAMGVVTRDQPGEILVKAIRKVDAGEMWLDRARVAALITRLARGTATIDDPDRARIEALTPREREIVALVTEGLRNRDIATRLSISEATVRNHLTSILDKLDLTDRFQLAVFAFRKGLVSCPQMPALMRISSEWRRHAVNVVDVHRRSRHVVREH
jgi:DNA-binding NarL/FixJ family response regulator